MKVPRQLRPLVVDGIIDAVLRPLMAGKEAAVYVVEAHGEICCAKVYKDATHRNFKNRADYQEGRRVRNSRRARAMQRGTRFGKRELEEDWQNAEVDALYRLAGAGVRVPRPLNFTGGVLIMELVVDADGHAAPRLNDVALTEDTAREYHGRLLRDVVRMLCAGLIHGDLSEYNVLVDADGPVIIDLPQAINAAANNSAKRMLRRDVGNLAAYFGRFAPELNARDYGREIWQLYERGELQPDSELTGRFKQPIRKADVGAVMRDIDDAREDARRRAPRAAKAPSKARKGDVAWRGRVPDDAGDDHAWDGATQITGPTGTRRVVDLARKQPPEPAEAGAAPKKKRRRRRRGGGGGGGGEGGAPPQQSRAPKDPPKQPGIGADASTDAPPKKRRRRRRRRQGPAAGDGGAPPQAPAAQRPRQDPPREPSKTNAPPPHKPRRRRSR